MTPTQALQPSASPSVPERDAGTRRRPHHRLRDLNRGKQSPRLRPRQASATRAPAGRQQGPARGGEAEPAGLRGPRRRQRLVGTEGGSGGVGRRRGKAAAGRHGSPRCHKKAGRRLSRAPLSPAATAVGAAAGAGRPAAGQQQTTTGMGTALAARLGLGLLLLALLLPRQVGLGAARRFPYRRPECEGQGERPRRGPSPASPPATPPRNPRRSGRLASPQERGFPGGAVGRVARRGAAAVSQPAAVGDGRLLRLRPGAAAGREGSEPGQPRLGSGGNPAAAAGGLGPQPFWRRGPGWAGAGGGGEPSAPGMAVAWVTPVQFKKKKRRTEVGVRRLSSPEVLEGKPRCERRRSVRSPSKRRGRIPPNRVSSGKAGVLQLEGGETLL